MTIEVVRQSGDPRRQERDLDFRGTGVRFVPPVPLDDGAP
jgi:hypothetical protein